MVDHKDNHWWRHRLAGEVVSAGHHLLQASLYTEQLAERLADH